MQQQKKWYQSKGVWGSLLAIIALAVGYFGYEFTPESQESAALALSALVGAVMNILAIFGRVKATKQIKK